MWVLLCGLILFLWVGVGPVWGMLGLCSNCHTMHNSQNGTPMVYNGSSTPNPMLLRGDCIGCHAQGGNQAIADNVPQVYHTDTTDLAGGNFAYITGLKAGGDGGSGSEYGHNVMDIPGIGLDEINNSTAPGGFGGDLHPGNVFNEDKYGVTCAGWHGCHGIRGQGDGLSAVKGAHHSNVNGLVNGTSVGDSYRFLYTVKGYEVSDWKNLSSTHHNEYYGLKSNSIIWGCGNTACHGTTFSTGVYTPDGTITQFCATCHPVFHSSNETGTSSPFLRHPTDHALPSSGEYANYNNGTLTYSVLAPVARTSWPISGISSTVTPGSDAVMCLSCHYAHAGPYPDMLRWNYNDCVASGGYNSDCGCFVCHTTKY